HPSETGEPLNVVSFASATHHEALAERRLRLVLSLSGKVLLVLAGDASVFGFDPQQLQGLVLGDFVDAFQAISHSKAALRLQLLLPILLLPQGMYMEGEDAVGSQPLASQHSSHVPAASAGLERLGSSAIGRTASWVPAPPPGMAGTGAEPTLPKLSRPGQLNAYQGGSWGAWASDGHHVAHGPSHLAAEPEFEAAPAEEGPHALVSFPSSPGMLPGTSATAACTPQPARPSNTPHLNHTLHPTLPKGSAAYAWVHDDKQAVTVMAAGPVSPTHIKQATLSSPSTLMGAAAGHLSAGLPLNTLNFLQGQLRRAAQLGSCLCHPHCPAALLPPVAAADNDVAAVDAVVGVAAAPKVGATALEPKLSRPSALELQGLQPGFTPVQPGPGVVPAAAPQLASPFPEQLPRMSSGTAAMAGAASATGGSDRAERVPTATLERVLLIMAAKAHSSPGVSWRIGVTKPPEVDHVAALGKLSAFSELVSSLNPAIMTMEVHLTGPKSKALAKSLSKSTTAVATPGPTSEKERIAAVLAHVDNNMALVVDLWRADLVTGVLELDEAGTVLHSTALPLYKPGLLFGVPCDRMPAVVVRPLTHCFAPGELQGTHISKFFPTAKNAPVNAFMVPGFGAPTQQPSGEASRKKSNLKVPHMRNRNLPGPVNVMVVKHHSDGDGLEVEVQGIRKPGGSTLYLLMRPHLPSSARPNLCKYLLLQREKEVAEAANVASLARYRRSSLINVNPSEAQLLLPAANLDAAAACSTQPVTCSSTLSSSSHTRNRIGTDGNPAATPPQHLNPPQPISSWCAGAAPPSPIRAVLPTPLLSPPPLLPPGPVQQQQGALGPTTQQRRASQLAVGQQDALAGPHVDDFPKPTHSNSRPELSTALGQAPASAANMDRIAMWVMTGGSVSQDSLTHQMPTPSAQRLASGSIAHTAGGLPSATASSAPAPTSPTRMPNPPSSRLPGQDCILEGWEEEGEEEGEEEEEAAEEVEALEAGSMSADGHTPNKRLTIHHPQYKGTANPDSPSSTGPARAEEHGGAASSRAQAGDNSDAMSDVLSQHAPVQIYGGKGSTEASDKMQATDFRRGQRLKKLQRLLLSPLVQGAAHTFQRHCLIVLSGIVITHLGLFVLQVILMSQQTAGVTDLNSVGIAARTVGKVTHSMHELDVLLSGRGQPNLPGLTGMQDYQGRNNFMNDLLTRAWDLHQGVYMGFDKRRRLPDKFGLRQIWDQPTQVETVYEDTSPVMTVYTRNVSLWDAGNNYVSKGADIWQNARARYAATNNFASWSNVQYIVDNGPNLMIPAYYQTMNAFLQTVIRQADTLNQIQLLVLLLEGVVVPLGAMLYLWILAMRVTNQRFNMFHVFVLVPVGLIRQLATMPIDLDEEDDDDGAGAVPGAEAGGAAGEAGNRGQTGVAPGGMLEGLSSEQKMGEGSSRRAARLSATGTEVSEQGIKLNLPRLKSSMSNNRTSRPSPSAPLLQKLWFSVHGLISWQRGNRVTQWNAKRKLRSSNRFAISLVLPILVWAIVNCTLNAVAYQHLRSAAAPCATFNIVSGLLCGAAVQHCQVNFFAARFQRVFFYAQELCVTADPALRNISRAILRPRYATMRTEYDAMLYGGSAVPGSSEPRFVLAKQGVVYSGGQGVDILYFTTQCLRVNASSCMGPEDPFYKWTHNGLDRLMRRYFELWESMINSTNGPVPNITGPEYEFMWRAKPDAQDGLDMLNEGFLTTVISIYSTASLLHYINFAFTVTLMLALYLLQLRPFEQEARNEKRRVAELLSQLPTEVAVMDLVARALQLPLDKQTGGAGNSSMRSMSSIQSGQGFMFKEGEGGSKRR
ncbi:hypothetical protein QJQ45_023113, partial [Haematococcus lacustris]